MELGSAEECHWLAKAPVETETREPFSTRRVCQMLEDGDLTIREAIARLEAIAAASSVRTIYDAR